MGKNSKVSNKSFGIVFFIFFLFLSSILFYKNIGFYIYFIILAFLFFILGLINSSILTPLNKIWMMFGDLLGKVISPIIMFFIYFGVVVLTKIFILILNKDILNLKLDKLKKTYWLERSKNINSMDNQF